MHSMIQINDLRNADGEIRGCEMRITANGKIYGNHLAHSPYINRVDDPAMVWRVAKRQAFLEMMGEFYDKELEGR